MFCALIYAVLLLKYYFPTGDQLERYCARDIFYSSQAAYNCYLLPNGATEQSRRHASAWLHRWPALLTILKKIPFISTRWPLFHLDSTAD